MLHVLYVDDDPVLARLVQKVLGRAGIEIAHAGDAASAEALIAGQRFDALVLDHYLPGGTGLDILRRLRADGGRTPTIYVTGSSEATVAIDALKAGADDYVIKSTGEDFTALLRRAIDQAIAKAELLAAKERADAETRAARERAEMLLAEVHHRVANSLSMVTSLLRLQASAASEEVRSALAEAQTRIAAISGVHRSLYLGDDVHTVVLDAYLHAMLQDFRKTIPESIRLTIEACPLKISADRAVSLGIVVSELATNAAKYAWPAGGEGELRVELTEPEPGLARLVVSDDGIGSDPAGTAIGTGLGQKLIRAMAERLEGSVAQLAVPKGTTVEVSFRV
ncbi:response regulator [Frigidibacter albus]|uniref:histidine kinase n=2 Tax=Frigidibacter mobilis TaxID=1335048 RepID=A0A159Z0W3_9RHOB|nr:signal transduction histidine kinase [Frigidibacter mobilis]